MIFNKNTLKLKNFISIFIFAAFILAIRFKPITQSFELDYDEGINLIKALLYSQGFSLYSQIWNDQAPLFTVILSSWLNLFGQSVLAARLLVLIFSSLLIWCFYQIISREVGKIPALIATVLLFTSWLYIRLSISVMIGLPSLSMAMLSIYFISVYKHNKNNIYLILSAIYIALSLQIKAFTVFMIPLLILYIWDFKINFYPNQNQVRKNFYPLVIWLGILSFIFIFIALSVGQFSHQDQLIQSHLNQPINEQIDNFNNLKYLNYMTSQDRDYIFLAIIGILAIFYKKQRNGFFPISWLATSILILLLHKPIWYHHYHLISIPICWLAAYGIELILDLFSINWRNNFKSFQYKKFIFVSIVSIIFILLLFTTPPITKGNPPKDLELMRTIIKYKKSTNWIFTDRPIYAFYAGLTVPPEIAVMSSKRINSGELSNQEMLAVLKKYHPEQIVLARMRSQIINDEEIKNYINKYYIKIYSDGKDLVEQEHYILANLVTYNAVHLNGVK